jgi:hypothetical protein
VDGTVLHGPTLDAFTAAARPLTDSGITTPLCDPGR